MGTHTVARVPAGTPAGGRFAPSAHTEPAAVDPPPLTPRGFEQAVCDLRNAAFDQAADLYCEHQTDTLADALGRLADVAADDGPDYAQLVTAEYFAFALTEGADPEGLAMDLDDSAPELLRGVDIDDYREWNEADRPGESGYPGYRWRDIAAEAADRWEAESERIARRITASRPPLARTA